MGKKFVYFSALTVLIGIVFVSPAFSQGYEVVECVSYATGRHSVGSTWTETKGGTKYTCKCDARQGTVCNPMSSGSTPSGPFVPSGKLSPSQKMSIQMMQGMFQPLFDAMFPDTFSPPDTSKQEELARQQEEERRKQEEMKKQALEAWQKAQKEMEAEMSRQAAQRKEAGQMILAQSRLGEDVRLEPSLFGTYQAKLEASSVSFGYPAPESEIDKALCAAYFSKLAKNTKDPEGAKFLSLQAEKVMQGAPTDYPCQFEKMPEVPVPQESYAKNEEVEAFINTYQAKLKEFEEIQTKVNEVRKQRLEAETRLKEADTKINELQTRSTTISKPEEKAQLDDLLSQAMAVKQEAENDLNTAKENEQKLLDTAKQKADEIKAINDQISALEKGNK
jgi:predicted  nucleic acid-binding Zn-ribbon protein